MEGLPLNRIWHHFDWLVVDRCIEGLLFMSLVVVLGNITMYSHYQSFFHIEMAEVAKIISHRGQGLTCHTMAADNQTNEGVSMDHFVYVPNRRRRYNLTLFLIDWVHTQNDARIIWAWHVNTLRLIQNGRRFADDTFKCIFFNENVWISFKISLIFVLWVQLTIFQHWSVNGLVLSN